MKRSTIAVLGAISVLLISSVASASIWDAFVIRNSDVGSVAPTITGTEDTKLFGITLGGQKAAWGTNSVNGQKIGDIQSVSITRANPTAGWGPYMNFWVTDGSGRYAVLGNEPSNLGEWGAGTAYNVTWDILKNATAKVYETNGQPFTLPAGKTVFTFNDFANYTIATPTVHWGGTGAPDVLGATPYTAYGFNWVFGDTQSNYLGGYSVSNPTITGAVPEPATIIVWSLLGLSAIGFGYWRRKRAA